MDRVVSQEDFEGPRMSLRRLVFLSDRVNRLIRHAYRQHQKQLYRYYLNPHRYFVLEVIANPDALFMKEKKKKVLFSYSIKIVPKCAVISIHHGK